MPKAKKSVSKTRREKIQSGNEWGGTDELTKDQVEQAVSALRQIASKKVNGIVSMSSDSEDGKSRQFITFGGKGASKMEAVRFIITLIDNVGIPIEAILAAHAFISKRR